MNLIFELMKQPIDAAKYGLGAIAAILILSVPRACAADKVVGKRILRYGVIFAVLAGLVDVYKFRQAHIPPVDVNGHWHYKTEGFVGGDRLQYGGICDVIQQGRTIRLIGERQWSRREDGAGQVSIDQTSYSWTSTWADLGTDGTIRFRYQIRLQSDTADGYCELSLRESDLYGFAALLPPSEPLTVSSKFWRNTSIQFRPEEPSPTGVSVIPTGGSNIAAP